MRKAWGLDSSGRPRLPQCFALQRIFMRLPGLVHSGGLVLETLLKKWNSRVLQTTDKFIEQMMNELGRDASPQFYLYSYLFCEGER